MTIDEIVLRWNDFESSEFRKKIKVGSRYYNGFNDITLPENGRQVFGLNEYKEDGKPKQTILSDRRIANNFFKFIITQQVAYGIARKFNITTTDGEETENYQNILEMIKSAILKRFFNKHSQKKRFQALNLLVSNTFSGSRYSIFVDACKNAPKEQIGWLYVYYNEKGELDFQNMPSEELLPIWTDEKKIQVEEMIRKYKVVEYDENGKKEVTYIDYFTQEDITTYRADEEDATPIEMGKRFYIKFNDGSVGTFPFLPFIPIKYNGEMTSLLDDIKNQVDAYDKIESEIANNIINLPDSLLAVSGFQGDDPKELDEFIINMKTRRCLFLPEGATASPILTPQDIAQIEHLLIRLRKDIFEIGGGVDTQNRELKDTSGVALRWSYSHIEEKFNVWAKQLEMAIRQIIELIIYDNKIQGGEDFSDVDYDIIFDTDSIINETETIQNLVLSKGLISAETIAAQHPYTKNETKEYEGMKKQMEFEASLNKKENNENNTHNENENLIGASL